MAEKTRRPGELPPLPEPKAAPPPAAPPPAVPPFPPSASVEPVAPPPPSAAPAGTAAPPPVTAAPLDAAAGAGSSQTRRLETDTPFGAGTAAATAPAAALAAGATSAPAAAPAKPASRPPNGSGPASAPPAAASPSPSASLVDPVIGTVIGDRYRIVERIGSGGMAAVYRAEHELLKKPVAVKLLLSELAVDQDMVARFEREAVAAARLDHPNCVAITDFGRTRQSRLFLVMELLDGYPLSEISGYGKRLPWERAVEITRQILRGLGRAHDMGIVHRDLKASNIMLVSRDGGRDIAKIIDFGIAKIFDGTQAGPHVETKAGVVFGTADFLAPERLLGKGDTDPRSDLYSVGIILYEMLTGTRPFHADDPYEIVKRALAEEPRAPSKVAPDAGIPDELEAVVLRALVKDPDKRYTTAREFLGALDPIGKRAASTTAYLAGQATSHPPAPAATAPPGAEAAARRQMRAFWIGVGVVATGAVVLALVFGLSSGGDGKRPPLTVHPIAPSASGGDVTPRRDGDEIPKLIKQAAEGSTLEARQSAFDRLVALGYVDRVPWTEKLSRDLEQLPTCEQRREVVLQLKKLKDPKALPALEKAWAREGNDCLKPDTAGAIAALGGQHPAPPPASPPATATSATPDKRPTRPTPVRQPSPSPSPRSKKSGGGGHF